MTRLSRAGWVRFLHAPASAVLLAMLLVSAAAGPVSAQTTDTLRAPVLQRDTLRPRPLPRIDTLPATSVITTHVPDPGRPISPGRAFVQSLLLPGRGQITLGKRNAATFYIAVEALGIGMTVKSLKALREAKRGVGDSTAVEWRTDPVTGDSVPIRFEPGRFTPERVNARRTHVEDWLALIIFNHLLAAADAYVAANLWDFPAKVSVRARPAPAAGRESAQSHTRLEATIAGSISW